MIIVKRDRIVSNDLVLSRVKSREFPRPPKLVAYSLSHGDGRHVIGDSINQIEK